MTAINLHKEAMDVAESAFLEQIIGDEDKAKKLFIKAYELERAAAMSTEEVYSGPLSQSVLMRSAVSLAINGGFYREAEQLACQALAGNPPLEIATELRLLLKDIYDAWNPDESQLTEEEDLQMIELIGQLAFADSLKNVIRLIDKEGNKFPYHIRVKEDFDDIVRNYWNDTIRVVGLTRDNSRRVWMKDIDRIEEN